MSRAASAEVLRPTGSKFLAVQVGRVRAEYVLLGHTHLPSPRRLVVNPGSVGQPRDGDPASFAVIENGTVALPRVAYEVERTVKRPTRAAGSPLELVDRLVSILRAGR